ncbi:hypothetical protein ACIPY3_22785 [Paenarthrobacter sp. NPDC089714]|uniref:hypothetical protein n=1 Tax=unclassified Paenarthrobacter TaxID=2634190 RepID=UPI0037FC978B
MTPKNTNDDGPAIRLKRRSRGSRNGFRKPAVLDRELGVAGESVLTGESTNVIDIVAF